jgi:hypothetical protein
MYSSAGAKALVSCEYIHAPRGAPAVIKPAARGLSDRLLAPLGITIRSLPAIDLLSLQFESLAPFQRRRLLLP